jgi:hypothetical protein
MLVKANLLVKATLPGLKANSVPDRKWFVFLPLALAG